MRVLWRVWISVLSAASALGQISGTVRDSVTQLPVAGAKILVLQRGGSPVETGATGEFRIEGLAPRKYLIVANREGYQNRSAEVEVTASGASVTLEMKPLAELGGMVRGEDGKPMEGVALTIDGHRYTTDREGRYDASDVTGGSYTVTIRIPFALRRATAVHDEKRHETFGYANTLFYPGVTDAKLAALVTIAPGSRVKNFDIDLRRTRLVEMKGRVVDAAETTEVELDASRGLPDGPYGNRTLDEHGGFQFDLLEPGDYTLAIHRNRPGDDLPYLTLVHLGEAGVQDLQVVLPPFARIDGTVRTAREELHWDGLLRITLGRLGYETEVRVGPDGQFTLNAIPPGEWNLLVDSALARRADDPTRKMYVGPELPASLRVTEGGNAPLEIVLTDQAARITGTVDGPGLISIRQEGSAHSTWRMAVPEANGAFGIDVSPGEYMISPMGDAPCAKAPAKVTVKSGETVNVQLKTCRGTEN